MRKPHIWEHKIKYYFWPSIHGQARLTSLEQCMFSTCPVLTFRGFFYSLFLVRNTNHKFECYKYLYFVLHFCLTSEDFRRHSSIHSCSRTSKLNNLPLVCQVNTKKYIKAAFAHGSLHPKQIIELKYSKWAVTSAFLKTIATLCPSCSSLLGDSVTAGVWASIPYIFSNCEKTRKSEENEHSRKARDNLLWYPCYLTSVCLRTCKCVLKQKRLHLLLHMLAYDKENRNKIWKSCL